MISASSHPPHFAMDARVPESTARNHDHVVLTDHDAVDFTNGELTWTLHNRKPTPADDAHTDSHAHSSNGLNADQGALREHQIVLVTRQSDTSPGYIVYAVRERDNQNKNKNPDPDQDPFRLVSISTPHLPQSLLDSHLLAAPPSHLLGRPVHVIVSTRSGTGLARAAYDSVVRTLLLAVASLREAEGYQLVVTTSRHSIRRLALERNGLIVLLSGDGGVVDMLNGAIREEKHAGEEPSSSLPTIALLPLGTGNALFHSLHRPLYSTQSSSSALVSGLRTLFRGVAAPLPTFTATFSPGSTLVPPPADNDDEEDAVATEKPVDALLGAIVASYGLHAQLVWESDTPAYRRHGAARFGMAAAELLRADHAYRAAVECRPPASASWTHVAPGRQPNKDDNNNDDENFTYVLAAMVSNLERTFTVSPAARPLDGRIRLVSFGTVGAERTMDIMKGAYADGAHVDMTWDSGGDKVVGYDEVDEVRVTIHEEDPRWRKLCIDGTIIEVVQGGWMAVRRTERARFDVLVDSSVL